jgi:hypothetical protein
MVPGGDRMLFSLTVFCASSSLPPSFYKHHIHYLCTTTNHLSGGVEGHGNRAGTGVSAKESRTAVGRARALGLRRYPVYSANCAWREIHLGYI